MKPPAVIPGMKRWRYMGKLWLIPETHEPGKQRPFGEGTKNTRRREAARKKQ